MKFVIGTSDSKNIKVDAMVLTDTRALINASSGLGKSWLMRLVAEHVASSVQTILMVTTYLTHKPTYPLSFSAFSSVGFWASVSSLLECSQRF